MSPIRITALGRAWTADAPRTFTVGRDAGADVVLIAPTVSRRHAEIRPTAAGDGWEVIDVGSSVGTYVDGRRVERAPLTGTTVVTVGEPGEGVEVTVEVTAAAAPAQPPVPPPPAGFPPPPAAAPAPSPFPATAPSPSPMGRPPSGELTPTMVGGVNPMGGPGLLVRRRVGGDLRFGWGRPVGVGRDPQVEVSVDDPAVSRLHAVLEPRPDGWWWVDRSTSGTYVGGERRTSFKLEEPTEVSLGHPTAGHELELVPVVAPQQAAATLARRRRKRWVPVVLVAALVLVVGVVVGALVVLDDGGGTEPVAGGSSSGTSGATGGSQQAATGDGTDDDPGVLSDAELDRAKQASVFIIAESGGVPVYTGSGSIVTSDGLILTNAHVAQPSAPGLGIGEDDPDTLLIALVSDDDDTPAEPRFQAETIVADGVLDLAVLRIVADADGNPMEPSEMDLPEPMPMGVSDDLRTGDEITALGFPAIAGLGLDNPLDRALTVTRGVVSTFRADAVIGSSRAEIDSDIRIGSGNSGGASIDNSGQLVGVNSAVITAATSQGEGGEFTGGSALIRPVDLAADILEIAEQGGDPSYVSPFLDSMPTGTDPSDAVFDAVGWTTDPAAACNDDVGTTLSGVGPGDTVFVLYLVDGLADGTPVGVRFTADGSELGTTQDTWSFGADTVCLGVPVDVPSGATTIGSDFLAGQDGGVVASTEATLAP